MERQHFGWVERGISGHFVRKLLEERGLNVASGWPFHAINGGADGVRSSRSMRAATAHFSIGSSSTVTIAADGCSSSDSVRARRML
jgi:hypothetical protein